MLDINKTLEELNILRYSTELEYSFPSSNPKGSFYIDFHNAIDQKIYRFQINDS